MEICWFCSTCMITTGLHSAFHSGHTVVVEGLQLVTGV